MALVATTDGYTQSIGFVNMNGSWSGWTPTDRNVRLRFQWGYGSFGTNSGYVESPDAAGSYSRSVGVDYDRTVKFRAHAYDYKGIASDSSGASSGDFRTYAFAPNFPAGLTAGTPTTSSVAVSGSVIPKTFESIATVYVQYRIGAGSWIQVGTPVLSGISGSSSFALSATISGLAPATSYEARFHIERTVANPGSFYSNSAFFTTAAVVSGVLIAPSKILSDGAMIAPITVLLGPGQVNILPNAMESQGEFQATELTGPLVGTFEDFVLSADRQEVVLCEITPSLTISSWTRSVGITPEVYESPLSCLYLTDVFPGGIYRKVTNVRIDSTDLVERSAMPDDSNRGWYWNRTTGILYVLTSTNASPATFIITQAFVTYYIATTGIVIDSAPGDATTGIYHWPWISGELPRISQYIEDQLLGIKITEGGSLGFTNAHGFFTRAIPEHNWKNKKISLHFGGRYNGLSLVRTQYVPFVTMLIDDISSDEESATIALKAAPKLLDRELPVTPFFEDEYPNLGQGVRGTKKMLGWGRGVIAPDLTDTTGFGVWTIADAAYQTLTAVHQVYSWSKTTEVLTLLSAGTQYSVNLTACTVTILTAGATWQNFDIVVDVTGKPQNTFSAIVKNILQSHLNIPTADLDLASFTRAETDAPQLLSVWLKQSRSIASLLATAEPGLASLERSVMGTLLYTPEGKWRVTIWEPGYNVTGLKHLRKEDLTRFSPAPKLGTVYSKALVHFAQDFSTGEWDVETATNLVVQYASETQDQLDVYTFLTGVNDASILAQRAQFLAGSSPLQVEFEERGALLAQANAGDIILVTFSPLPIIGGAASAKAFEIIRLDRALNPMLTISGLLTDLRGIGEHIGRWTATDSLSWIASSTNERAISGFWADENNLVDPSDPTSRGKSLWW